VRVSPPLAASLAHLLAWDAPFLPVLGAITQEDGGISLSFPADGVPVRAGLSWPRARRIAVALQLVATVEFCFERGWFLGRAELWAARVGKGVDGDLVTLAALPRRRLDDPVVDRRLRGRPALGGDPRGAVLAPVLRALVPERWAALEAVILRETPWALGGGLIAVLSGDGKGSGALRHPGGAGRALWARRFSLPESGAVFVDDEAVLDRLAVAARLAAAAAGRRLSVTVGALDETEVARVQARAAADSRDALVLTTVPGAGGAMPLAMSGGEAAVWTAGVSGTLARQHATGAVERAAGRAALVADALAAGAAAAFSAPPSPLAGAARYEQLASPPARAALRWLRQAPLGLDEAELAALDAAGAAAALAELERLRLAVRRGGRCFALAVPEGADAARLETMAARLGVASWAGAAAAGLRAGEWRHLEERCTLALSRGEHGLALAAARALPRTDAIRLAGAEGALALGVLADAESLLGEVGESGRSAGWHALMAWWADHAGLPARARDELALAVSGPVPDRLAARMSLVAAEFARRDGDVDGELRRLREACAHASGAADEAGVRLALLQGGGALRRLWRSQAAGWPADLRARALHLLGYAAMSRGSFAAAGTAMRAALRTASGANPMVLGEIHSDLGTLAVRLDQDVAAERHLQLADRFLERCGSRRSITVVRYNRGVVANDRLDWQSARALILASRELRGGVVDSAYWFEELELARCQLARGDGEAVRAALPRLLAGLAQHAEHEVLHAALASLRGHLALADGDIAGAVAAAAGADSSEAALIRSVADAAAGRDPAPLLSPRWGIAETARALACWRRGDRDGARTTITLALGRAPREAAVGLVRLAAVLSRGGEGLDDGWSELRRRCEAILVTAGLDGWGARLRALLGLDVTTVLRAANAIAAAGPDALSAGQLEPLARVLGLGALEVRRGGARLARWGAEGEPAARVVVGPVEVLLDRTPDGAVRAVAELLATLAASTVVPQVSGGAGAGGGAGILGTSRGAAALRAEVARWAPLPLTVLVLGEPGTGKELVARELHRASGRRGAFVPVNCAGIPATLLEAELFGVVRGAYTGADRDRPGLVETAERGTLFLDEIGELPIELQAKLLRLLQDREVRRVGATSARAVDVRFLAATNRDLKAAVAAGVFRQDLYYRLSVAIVAIPPLRERPEDIEELAHHFVAQYGEAFNRPGVRLARSALTALREARWPGNVRELDSALARAVATARPGEAIAAEHLSGLEPAAEAPSAILPWTAAVEAFRRGYFAAMLRATGGNRSEAARRAGLSRQALLYHLRHLGKLD
jgi:DNA-binding NtrC family response regulator